MKNNSNNNNNNNGNNNQKNNRKQKPPTNSVALPKIAKLKCNDGTSTPVRRFIEEEEQSPLPAPRNAVTGPDNDQNSEPEEAKVPTDNTGTHIIVKDVEGFPDYAYSTLGDFTIMIRKSDGFVNITAFLNQYGNSKRKMSEWVKLKSSQEYLRYLNGPDGITSTPPIAPYDPKLHNKVRGTYVTVDIAYAVAMWVDIKYFHKVIQVVKEYEYNVALAKYQALNSKLIAENQYKDVQLSHKSQQICRLDKLIAEVREEKNQTKEYFERLFKKHDEQMAKMNEQHEQTLAKLNEAEQQRTMHQNNVIESLKTRGIDRRSPDKKRYFAILKISSEALLAEDEGCNYRKVAGQRASIDNVMSNLQQKYGDNAVTIVIMKKHTTGIDFGAALFDRLQNLIQKHSVKTSRFGIKNHLITERHIVLAIECLANSLLSINGVNYTRN